MPLCQYLERELARLDLLLHREILRLRTRYQLTLDEFRGLYVSDEHVDSLVRQSSDEANGVEEISRRAEELRAANWSGRPPQWSTLETEFGLTPFEQDVVLVALARELNLKYETVYAYLHNDVTRKKPTVELALRVCAPADRDAFLPEGRLFSSGLLVTTSDSNGHLGRELSVAMPALRYLTGLACESVVPGCGARKWRQNEPITRSAAMSGLFVVETGDSQAAYTAIEAACHATGKRLLNIDLRGADLEELAGKIRLVQRLEQCGVVIRNAAVWSTEAPAVDPRRFFEHLSTSAGPVWVPLDPESQWRGRIPGDAMRVIRLRPPDFEQRRSLWIEELPSAMPDTAAALASRYSLNATQIRSAAAYARDILALRGEARTVDAGDVAEAIRAQSESTIGRFARHVATAHTWDDLVVPTATIRQLREVAGAIRHHHTVIGAWGFGRKHSGIEGLKILFAGNSGTGKTMAAGIIGNDLGLEVFRIDLAGVVSKYIGETEKNLDAVFRAARGSHSILFFDEADALFGKRSEVRDAHDRYANIEVAYLLQKLEEHAGPVILASNFRRNMDEAFSRRLHYIVEFPAPDEMHRHSLWSKVFPSETPLATDVDFGFLAAHFPITGGDIRNIAVDAAFLAAQDGGVVTMQHLVGAMSRQMLKQGKAPVPADFRQYHALISARTPG